MAILSFSDPATADIYHGRNTSRARRVPHAVRKIALRKLDVLNAAHQLVDLRSPPGNRLEALKGNLSGYYSIRINEQWRIIFRWHRGAQDVAIVDYH